MYPAFLNYVADKNMHRRLKQQETKTKLILTEITIIFDSNSLSQPQMRFPWFTQIFQPTFHFVSASNK